LRTTLNLVQLR